MRRATALPGARQTEAAGPFMGLLLTRARRPGDATHNHRAYFIARIANSDLDLSRRLWEQLAAKHMIAHVLVTIALAAFHLIPPRRGCFYLGRPDEQPPGNAMTTPRTDPENAAPSAQREADHRIANSIQLSVVMLRHQALGVEDQGARQVLDDMATRLLAIARMHRQFANTGTRGPADLRPYLESLGRDLEEILGLRCEMAIDSLNVDPAVAAQIGVVVNELVVNAAKHAPDRSRPLSVSLTASREDSGALHLEFADSGPGFPAGFRIEEAPGLGMRIIASAVSGLGGSITLSEGRPCLVRMRFPLG